MHIERNLKVKKFKDIKIRNQIRILITIVVLLTISSSSSVLYFVGKKFKRKEELNYDLQASLIEYKISSFIKNSKATQELDSNDIYNMINNTALKIEIEENDDAILLIEDAKNILKLKGNNNLNINKEVLKELRNESEDKYRSIEKKHYLYLERKINDTNIKIIILIPKESIGKEISFLRPLFEIIRVLSLIIIVFCSRIMISAIIKPVNQIVNKIDEYEPTNKNKCIETSFENEISEIAMHINIMLKRIKKSNDKLLEAQKSIFELEIEKTKAELSYWQSQINPHFLYNTLECIRSLSTIYEAPEIEELSLSMAKIFRYAVGKETVVTLREELACARDYASVMMLRFPGKYEYIVDVDEDIMDIQIVKMTLQPIIENCFKYGINNKKKKAKICIRSSESLNNINIEIIDTGNGISNERLKEINRCLNMDDEEMICKNDSTGLGLKNINKRIKLCFGKKYGLNLKASEGYFTKVIIKMPPKKQNMI